MRGNRGGMGSIRGIKSLTWHLEARGQAAWGQWGR
jgi:hypothetical protein